MRHRPRRLLPRKATRPAGDTASAETKRLRNFACVCPPQRSKLLVYLKADPKAVDLVPGFSRDVTGLGHHGTGDLEVQLRTTRDVERAESLFRASYAAA